MRHGRIPAAIAAAAMAMSALAGCAGAEPGVVAYVGGAEITDRQLTDAVEGIESTLEPGQQILQDRVVNTLIVGEISTRLAADNKIKITDTERETLLKGSQLEPFLAELDTEAASVVSRLEGMRGESPQDIATVADTVGLSEEAVRAAHKRGMFKLRMAYGRARKEQTAVAA